MRLPLAAVGSGARMQTRTAALVDDALDRSVVLGYSNGNESSTSARDAAHGQDPSGAGR